MVGNEVGIKVGNIFQYITKKIEKILKKARKFQLIVLIPTITNLKPIKAPEKVKIIKYREKVGKVGNGR